MAGAVNRIDIWALDEELYTANSTLSNNEFLVKYYSTFDRIFNRALSLLDTNRPKIGIKILEFFTAFVRINLKIKDINQTIQS